MGAQPDAIVLAGGVSNMEMLYTLIPQKWGRHVFSDSVDTVLLKAAYGDSSGVRGAASCIVCEKRFPESSASRIKCFMQLTR